MKVARVPSPSRTEKGSQAYLWWICIRMLLLFAVALLPFVAVGVAVIRGLDDKTTNSRESPPAEAPEMADIEADEVAEAGVAE
jgi:hypothetical protein